MQELLRHVLHFMNMSVSKEDQSRNIIVPLKILCINDTLDSLIFISTLVFFPHKANQTKKTKTIDNGSPFLIKNLFWFCPMIHIIIIIISSNQQAYPCLKFLLLNSPRSLVSLLLQLCCVLCPTICNFVLLRIVVGILLANTRESQVFIFLAHYQSLRILIPSVLFETKGTHCLCWLGRDWC